MRPQKNASAGGGMVKAVNDAKLGRLNHFVCMKKSPSVKGNTQALILL